MRAQYRQRRLGELHAVELPGDPAKGAVVLLHGYGANALDLFSISECYSGPTWIFPQGPLSIPFGPNYTGQAWFPVNTEFLTRAIQEGRFDEISRAFPPEINQARLLVEQALAELEVPLSKIVLGGFSQGAILAIETMLKSPSQYAGLLIFSGTLINSIDWKRLAPLHAKTPFFQSHGSHDPLLPLQKAVELENLLLAGGLKGGLFSFNGGHEIPHAALSRTTGFLKTIFKT